jgi:hypothetical protein
MRVAKAKRSTSGQVQHTWKVVRINNQAVDISADEVAVVDGDLVFSTGGVIVRVIAANTYTDVELLGPQATTAAVSALFQNRPTGAGKRS